MTMFYTAEYLAGQIAEKEKELSRLRELAENAKIREFYWHIANAFDTENQAFLDAEWTLSFMGKSVSITNDSAIYGGIETALIEYMENAGIEFRSKEA